MLDRLGMQDEFRLGEPPIRSFLEAVNEMSVLLFLSRRDDRAK